MIVGGKFIFGLWNFFLNESKLIKYYLKLKYCKLKLYFWVDIYQSIGIFNFNLIFLIMDKTILLLS